MRTAGDADSQYRWIELSMATDEPGLVMRQTLPAQFREHGEQELHG